MSGIITINLSLVLTEMSCLAMAYLFFTTGGPLKPVLNPWSFMVLAPGLVAANLILNKMRARNITIGLADGVILFLGAWIMLPEISFTPSYITALIFILLIGGRCLFLVWNKEFAVFLHFDACMSISFLIYLADTMRGITLPQGAVWLLASGALNFITLFLVNNTKVEEVHYSRRMIVLAGLILLPLLIAAKIFFPYLTSPARFLVRATETAAFILGYLLSGYNDFINGLAALSYKSVSYAIKPYYGGYSGPLYELNLPWIQLLLLLVIVLITAAVIIHQLYRLFVWLLQRRPDQSQEIITKRGSARGIPAELFRFIQRWGRLVRLWLSNSLSAYRAYRYLLWWGQWKNHPRQRQETPFEYYERLAQIYPDHRQELVLITNYYVQYRYSAGRQAKEAIPNLAVFVRRLYRLFSLPTTRQTGRRKHL